MPWANNNLSAEDVSEFNRRISDLIVARDRMIRDRIAARERVVRYEGSDWTIQHDVKLTKAEEAKFAEMRLERDLAAMLATYESRGIEPLREWDE